MAGAEPGDAQALKLVGSARYFLLGGPINRVYKGGIESEGIMSNEVAKTILSQLGGKRFVVMTGAKNFVGGNNRLTFTLPRGTRAKGQPITGMWITLTSDDLYKIEAVRFDRKNAAHVVVDSRDGIYCAMLQETFTRMTGLYTRLWRFFTLP